VETGDSEACGMAIEVARVCVVTGGSSGIGAAIVEGFAAAGDSVVVFDISARPVDALPQAARAHVRYEVVDVGSEDEVQQGFASVIDDTGRVDVLVNCAGIDLSFPLIETTLEDWSRVQRTNVTGMFLCTKAAARDMVVRREGSIVSVSSVHGILGCPTQAAYSASKGAIDAFTRSVAAELGQSGIRVNAVAPGAIDTPIWGDSLTPEVRAINEERCALGFVGMPRDVAEVVLFLASAKARYITGTVVSVDGGRATYDYVPTS